MTPDDPLKLLGHVRDLQIVDVDGRRCGVVDDIECAGGVGKPLALRALLVGPGAYKERLPTWLFWLVTKLAGDRLVRVPWSEVETITNTVQLRKSAREYGLMRAEDALKPYIERIPFT